MGYAHVAETLDPVMVVAAVPVGKGPIEIVKDGKSPVRIVLKKPGALVTLKVTPPLIVIVVLLLKY